MAHHDRFGCGPGSGRTMDEGPGRMEFAVRWFNARSFHYRARISFCELHFAKNCPISRIIVVIRSRSGIFFQILRALLYKPPKEFSLSPWERAGVRAKRLAGSNGNSEATTAGGRVFRGLRGSFSWAHIPSCRWRRRVVRFVVPFAQISRARKFRA
jgi:hypothetical protein